MLDRNAVSLRRLQAQIREDLSCIGKAFFIPGQATGMRGPHYSVPWESPSKPAFSSLRTVKINRLAHSNLIIVILTMIIAATIY